MSDFAQQERRALCDLFSEVGPDAPTLCEGWRTADLAAHLVVRERRPDAAGGILFPPLAGYLDRVQRSVRDGRPWRDLVARVQAGPPVPLRWVDEPFNTAELFVHHEDVRRAAAGWEPRTLPPGLERALWSRVRFLARPAGRKAGVGLVVEAPGFGQVSARHGPPSATLSGPPGELVLYLFGRKDVARVGLTGDPSAIEKVAGADVGL
ncbi:MAG: TIGR03085 family metal-binding protein [Acidimicrobiales bacterium]